MRLKVPLTAQGAACLVKFPHLQHLTTTAALHTHYISKLTGLASVTLQADDVTTTDLFALQALPKLHLLKLLQISIHAVEPILAITQLQHLVVESSAFSFERHKVTGRPLLQWQQPPADESFRCSRLKRLDLRRDLTGMSTCVWPAAPLPEPEPQACSSLDLAALLQNVGHPTASTCA